MAFTKPSVKLGTTRMGTGSDRHTDTMEFLSPGVLIAYKARPGYPTLQMKTAVNSAAIQARNIVRIANDELAKVVLLRRPESQLMIDTVAKHYWLIAGDLAGGFLQNNVIDKPFKLGAVFDRDRRWVLNKIREMLLSLSAHLNTGVYIIDQDIAARDVFDGQRHAVGHAPYNAWVGYVHPRGPNTVCGFRNGEIHVDFVSMLNYSLNTNACIIIHEAAHKYLNILGDIYGNDDINYPPPLQRRAGALENADCLAWTAVSLATGAVRMQQHSDADFTSCPGAAL